MIMPAADHERFDFAQNLIVEAGDLALRYFANVTELSIISKGAQDMVSEADLAVEALIRERLMTAYPAMPIWGRKPGTQAAAATPESGSSTPLMGRSPS
jgi:myo-inositol-1(or 4)-monophosphatase